MIKVSNIFELILFAFIIIITTYYTNGAVEISGLKVTHFLMIAIFLYILIIPFFRYKRTVNPSSKIYWLFIFIIFYGILRVLLSDSPIDKFHLISPFILAFFAITIPFSFSKLITNSLVTPLNHIYKLSMIVTFTSLYFCFNFYFAPEFAGRLAMPLGGAAVSHVALFLTLVVYLSSLKVGQKKTLSILLSIATLIIIIFTASRSGLLTVFLFVFLFSLDLKKPLRSAGIFTIMTTIFVILFKFLPTDRYSSFEDTARTINLETSINAVFDSIATLIIGNGSLFPWYAYEYGNLKYNTYTSFASTPFGYALTNPHSVFMGILTELGLIGLVPFIIILLLIFKAYIKSLKNDDTFISGMLLGILCTIPAFALDYYLFKNFPVSVIWWYFVFFAVSAGRMPSSDASIPNKAL